MASVTVQFQEDEVTLLKLAREIAVNIHPIEAVLEQLNVSPARYEQLKGSPHFQQILQSCVAEWESALNTNERVKLKAAALIEHWLPELNKRIHDGGESLAAKIEGAKFAARLADMGLGKPDHIGIAGERVVVNINLGADQNIRIEKEVGPRVIDVTPTEIS